ncbi:lysine-specific demethylase 2A [Neosynchiropus ocellatus]
MMEDPNTRYSKRLRTGTRRRYQDDGISDDEIEGKRTFDLDEKLECSRFGCELVKHMEGKDFTFEYIQREGLREPIIFEKADGLGLQMPDSNFSVSDVKLFVGSRRIVDVMDVNTQKGIEMSMSQWRRYYETPPSEREKLYNVISLEFSHTKLENLVQRPASVDLIDWVDNMWPRHLKERQRDSTNAIIDMHYPKVQKYCLMSVQGCFTDFHIDFGGTSVWYHILRGGKVFWLIPPTPQNLDMYENWVLSGKQGDIFLGDKCHDCQRIELKQGYTFLIPSGWIHAVYTPEDTLVFGGNFLHSFNIPMQLNIYSIEDRTRVPAKFRYPFYYEMCWYVLERYLYCLTNISHLTPEFQKYSLGIGLTPADIENPNAVGNGNSNGVDGGGGDDDGGGAAGAAVGNGNGNDAGDIENKEMIPKENEIKVEDDSLAIKPHQVLTHFELEGLWNLLGKLEELPAHKKCVPEGIADAEALLRDMRRVLLEHPNDDPKLSYTGEPIVKWSPRPSWYQPPIAPPPVIYRPRLPTPVHKLQMHRTKGTSISALRRRRVRCKYCAGCCRKECGNCLCCQDMRKFGGPGRMKKGCIMRQCLTPALPNTARCHVCGEGEAEDTHPSLHTLMECTVCTRITHRHCMKEPGEGKICEDLPSCWECPKCSQGNGSTSESSSDEESGDSEYSVSLPASKKAYREGIGVGDVVGRQNNGRSSSQPTAPPPSQRLLLQHQQSRKRANELELKLKKRMKLERSKMLIKHPKLDFSSRQRGAKLAQLRATASRLTQVKGRAATSASSAPYHSASGGSGSFQSQSSVCLALEHKGEARRGRGRGVRLRGGAAGRGMISGQRLFQESEDSSCSSTTTTTSSSSSDEEEEEAVKMQNGRDAGDPGNSPQSKESAEAGDPDGDGFEMNNHNGTEECEAEEMVTDSKDGSSMKLTLIKPTEQASTTIVPKLEAITPQAAAALSKNRHLGRPPIRNHKTSSNRHTPPLTRSQHSGAHTSHLERRKASKKSKPSRAAKPTNGATSSLPKLPDLETPPQQDRETQANGDSSSSGGGGGPSGDREVWVSVFRYLNRADLCVCMAVCKNWYKWCLDKRLWSRIDLSIKRTISSQALTGIIKRQPATLDLSWTNISKKQLNWLVQRLLGLRDLMLAGCSWATISALSSSGCPPLRSLDLRYADGVKDAQFRELITPSGSSNRSQLRTVHSLRLAGLDISDVTLRLVIRHMPQLTKLDLANCVNVTDNSINLLTAVGSSTRNTLTEINLAGCNKLTDSSLKYLRRLASISRLDLRGCQGVSRMACENFIAELSVNTLYCLSDEKLIQRIS